MPFRGSSSAGGGCYITRLQTGCHLCPALASGPSSSWEPQPPGELTSGQLPPHHEARPKAPSSTQSLWHVLWAQDWHTVVLSRLDWVGSMQAGEEPEVRALSSGCTAAGTLNPSGEPLKVPGPKRGGACAVCPRGRGLLKSVLQTVYPHPSTALSFSPKGSLLFSALKMAWCHEMAC